MIDTGMDSLHNYSLKSWEVGGLLIFGLSFIAVMICLEHLTLNSQMHLEIETEKALKFQLFWKRGSEEYSELKSILIPITPEKKVYTFPLPAFAEFDCLRIDPADQKASLKVNTLKLTGSRIEPIDLLHYIRSEGVEASTQLELRVETDSDSIQLQSLGTDPHFEICFSYSGPIDFGWKYLLGGLLSLVILFGYLFGQERLKGSRKRVILLLGLPKNNVLKIDSIKSSYRMRNMGIRHEEREDSDIYRLEVEEIDPREIPRLLEQLKADNPEANFLLQYNRSGEV